MNWIENVVRPKIRSFLNRRETPENLWIKCPETGQLVFYKDVEQNQFVIPSSNYHMRISAPARLKSLFDGGEYEDIPTREVQADPLKFRDERRYADRLKDARNKTNLSDAVKVGFGKLDGLAVTAAVQDFDFMGGSLGMAAGEAVVCGLETAATRKTPFIMFAASGGARMQEGILSLMQLPRTTAAVVRGNCINDKMPSCMRAPPDAANMMKGVLREAAVSSPQITASPAAIPSEPPMKSKSCTAAVTGRPSSLPNPTFTASARPVLFLASLRRSA